MEHSGQASAEPAKRTRGEIAREEILSATVKSLLQVGYAATTTLAVQERAGCSRGKLLHHFPSKRELILGAIRYLAADRMQVSDTDTSDAPDAADLAARVRWAVPVLWKSFFQNNFWVAIETWIAARTDPELAEELHGHERAVLRQARRNTVILFGDQLAALPAFERMRDVIFTSMRGMALTYTFSGMNPETEPMVAMWIDTALELLDLDQ